MNITGNTGFAEMPESFDDLDLLPFQESSLDVATQLYVTVFGSSPWREEWQLPVARKRLEEILRCPNYMGFIAIDHISNSAIAFGLGWFETWHNGRLFQIKELCVHPAWQGKGLGHKLLDKIETEAFRSEAIEIYLSTSREVGAYGFYSSNGYTDSPSDVLMRKRK